MVIAIAFLLLWSCYALMVDSRFYIFEGGSAHYLVMAKSLAQHHQYREFHLPTPEPHIKIPPLLSLMLSLIYYFLGMDILAIKIFFLLCLAFASVIGYSLFLKLTRDWKKALLIICSSLLLPLNFSLMQKVASEIPFLAFSYLSLYFLVKAGEEKFSFAKSIAIGALVGLSCLLRTAGLAMIPAFILFVLSDLLIKKSRKYLGQYLVILVISSAIFSSWAIRNQLVKTETQKGYFNFILMDAKPGSLEQGMNDLQPPLWNGTGTVSLQGFGKRIAYNLGFYGNALAGQVGGKKSRCLWAILLPFALLGLVSGWRKNLIVTTCGILYVFQILAWHFTDARFLSPVSGLLIFWIVSGAFFIKEKFSGRAMLSNIIYFLACLLVLGAMVGFCRQDYQIWKHTKHRIFPRTYTVSRHFEIVPLTRERDSLAQLLIWIKGHTEKDAVIAAIDPYLVNLVADRKAAFFPATENNREFWDYFAKNQIRYIMVDEIYQDLQGGVSLMTDAYLLPALQACPYRLEKVWQVPFSRTMLLSISYEKP